MRVLFSSVGAPGHVYPMVPLAQAFVAGGHDARWVCTSEMCPVIERAGIPTIKATNVDRILAEDRPERAERMGELSQMSPKERNDYLFPWIFGELLGPAMLGDLLPVIKQAKPQLVVHDYYEFAGPLAATAAGAAHVAHALGPELPERDTAAAGERMAPLWKEVGAEPKPHGGLYDHLYLDIYPPSLQPGSVDPIGHRELLRPIPYPLADPTANLPVALAANPDWPLVYLTFGTQLTRYETLRLVVTAISRLKVRLLVTVGTHAKLDTFPVRRPGVVIENFVPQSVVLAHADAVVSHGGSGTILAGLAAGLPQLILPYHGDQLTNGEAVASGGAGLTFDIDPLYDDEAADAVAQAVTRLLDEQTFKDSAGRIAEEIAGMPSPQQVAGTLVELAG